MLEVTVAKGRRVRRRGIRVHEATLVAADVTTIDAIPVTSPTRTLIDLASVVTPEVLEEALDDALRRGLTSLVRLRRRIDELGRRGRKGIAELARMVAVRSPGATSGSGLETRFLRLIRRTGLPEPERQHRIRDRGRLLARVDFAYPDVKLAIETDGYRWHSSRQRWEHDLGRRNALTSTGWRVVHVTSTDLDDGRIVRMIRDVLGERKG
jgi:very-short-patch-repair endonuclease